MCAIKIEFGVGRSEDASSFGTSHDIYSDITDFDPGNVDRFHDTQKKWDEHLDNIETGTHFNNKKEIMQVLTM